jgi:hypothetical protein
MATKKADKESGTPSARQGAAQAGPKRAPKVNNVASKNKKVSEKAEIHPETVNSNGKQAGTKPLTEKAGKAKAPTQGRKSTSTRAPARGRKPYTRMTDAVIDNIIDLLHSNSLSEICQLPGMPERTTFCKRLAADVELQKRYAVACEARADKFVDEIIQIADDGANDTYLDEEGNKRTDHDVIARSKLRVDARKWAAAKMAPKKYGDRVGLDHGVQPDNPLAALLAKVAGSALPIASNLPDDSDDE